MSAGVTVVAGLPIPSTSPVFLGVVAAHASLALVAVVAGLIAMLSPKRVGRHPTAGSVYYWCLGGVFVSALLLVAVRWRQDYLLALLGGLSFAAATVGRSARRKPWKDWPIFHIGGMGSAYVLMLTAFYVDNGPNLPVWRRLPPPLYWLIPAAIGMPLIIRAILQARLRFRPTGETSGL